MSPGGSVPDPPFFSHQEDNAMPKIKIGVFIAGVFGWLLAVSSLNVVLAADPTVLKPRVPVDQIEEAKTWQNSISL